jgi:MFS family permease
VFFAVSFAVTIALAFYYGFAGTYLGESNFTKVGSTMAFGQVSEILFMLLLPFALRWIGMKYVLAIGMLAWVVRYGLFAGAADGQVKWMILIGVLLHGVCFDFFLAAGFIHTENKAPAAIRGSAQALFSFLTYGVGMWIGNLLSGAVAGRFTDAAGKTDWARMWTVPAVGAAVCFVVFLVLWRDRAGKVTDEPIDPQGFPVRALGVPQEPDAGLGQVAPEGHVEPVVKAADVSR